MRLVQFPIPPGERDTVLAFLDEEEFDYTLVEEVSGRDYGSVVAVPAETDDLDLLMDGLRERGIQERGFIAVGSLEALVSYRYEASEDATGVAREADEDTRIAHEELLSHAQEMTTVGRNYVVLIALSAVVAAAGLHIDSAAVLVGSMVIAPLLGPAIGASVGRMIHEPTLFREGVRGQALGIGVAVVSALAFSVVARYTLGAGVEIRILEELAQRRNPGALSVVIAIASGVAGALAFTTGATATLVGVMIAAALIPPAAAVGIGVAFGDPVLAVSAAVLVLVNVPSINLASMVVLWLRGYRPKRYRDERVARTAAIKQIAVLLVGVLVLSSFLAVTTLDATRNEAFENDVERALRSSGATVLSHSVSYETSLFTRTPTGVTVVVTDDSPAIAGPVQREIRQVTGYDVTVTVIREETTVVEGEGPPDPSR